MFGTIALIAQSVTKFTYVSILLNIRALYVIQSSFPELLPIFFSAFLLYYLYPDFTPLYNVNHSMYVFSSQYVSVSLLLSISLHKCQYMFMYICTPLHLSPYHSISLSESRFFVYPTFYLALYQNLNLVSSILPLLVCLSLFLPSFSIVPLSCALPACDKDPELCPGRTVCAPQPLPSLVHVNSVVVIAFTIEYLVRLILSGTVSGRLAGILPREWPEQEMGEGISLTSKKEDASLHDPPAHSWYYQIILYGIKFYNLIDLISIVPYYISYVHAVPSLVFFRILRLTRVVTLLKVSATEKYTNLLNRSISLSVPLLTPLAFYVSLLMIFFGCLMYVCEKGTFVVSELYPSGAYVRPDVSGFNSEESPFQSIPDGIYFVVITATTIGYGDIYPTTQFGRFLSCIIVYVGILITAFPIAIISQNFVSEYTKMMKQSEIKEKEHRADLLTDFKNVPKDLKSEKIIKESHSILKILLSDTASFARHARALDGESKKISSFSAVLKQVVCPPCDWDDDL